MRCFAIGRRAHREAGGLDDGWNRPSRMVALDDRPAGSGCGSGRNGGKRIVAHNRHPASAWRCRGLQANPDGTASLVTTGADFLGADLLVGQADGKRTLTMRDGQHTYVYAKDRAAMPGCVKTPPDVCPAGLESSKRESGAPSDDQYAPAGLACAAAAFLALCL